MTSIVQIEGQDFYQLKAGDVQIHNIGANTVRLKKDRKTVIEILPGFFHSLSFRGPIYAKSKGPMRLLVAQ